MPEPRLYIPMIDISPYQGSDFSIQTAVDAGVEVIMVRLGIGVSEDPQAKSWIHEIASLGKQWMAYWFIDFPAEIEAEEQAAAFIDAYYSLGTMNGAPLWMDIESYKGSQLSIPVWSNYLNTIKLTLSTQGLPQGVYSNKNTWDNMVRLNWSHLPRIIAHWVNYGKLDAEPAHNPQLWDEWAFFEKPAGPSMPRASREWDVWQFSDSGNGPSLGCTNGNSVDCNLMRAASYEKWFNV